MKIIKKNVTDSIVTNKKHGSFKSHVLAESSETFTANKKKVDTNYI